MRSAVTTTKLCSLWPPFSCGCSCGQALIHHNRSLTLHSRVFRSGCSMALGAWNSLEGVVAEPSCRLQPPFWACRHPCETLKTELVGTDDTRFAPTSTQLERWCARSSSAARHSGGTLTLPISA